jgi:hypothetical protein
MLAKAGADGGRWKKRALLSAVAKRRFAPAEPHV